MSNAVQTLTEDEQTVLEKYRAAKSAKFSSVEIHVHWGKLVRLDVTVKYRPEQEMAHVD